MLAERWTEAACFEGKKRRRKTVSALLPTGVYGRRRRKVLTLLPAKRRSSLSGFTTTTTCTFLVQKEVFVPCPQTNAGTTAGNETPGRSITVVGTARKREKSLL